MPNNKKLVRRKKKRKFRKRVKKFENVAHRALDVALKVKRLLNVEQKFHDLTVANIGITSSGLTYNLAAIQQGVAGSDRVGDSIRIQSMLMRMVIKSNATSTQINTIRVMMVIDRQFRGVAPSTAEILEASDPLSPLNHDTGYRFKVLYDELIITDESSDAGMTRKLFLTPGTHVKYDGILADDASCEAGVPLLVLQSDSSANHALLSFYHRLRYTDN